MPGDYRDLTTVPLLDPVTSSVQTACAAVDAVSGVSLFTTAACSWFAPANLLLGIVQQGPLSGAQLVAACNPGPAASVVDIYAVRAAGSQLVAGAVITTATTSCDQLLGQQLVTSTAASLVWVVSLSTNALYISSLAANTTVALSLGVGAPAGVLWRVTGGWRELAVAAQAGAVVATRDGAGGAPAAIAALSIINGTTIATAAASWPGGGGSALTLFNSGSGAGGSTVVLVANATVAAGLTLDNNGVFAPSPLWVASLPPARGCAIPPAAAVPLTSPLPSTATVALGFPPAPYLLVGASWGAQGSGAVIAVSLLSGAVVWTWQPSATLSGTSTFSCSGGAPIAQLLVDGANTAFTLSNATYALSVAGGTAAPGGVVGAAPDGSMGSFAIGMSLGIGGAAAFLSAAGAVTVTAIPPAPLPAAGMGAWQQSGGTGQQTHAQALTQGPTHNVPWAWLGAPPASGLDVDRSVAPLIDASNRVHLLCAAWDGASGGQLLWPSACPALANGSAGPPPQGQVVAITAGGTQLALVCDDNGGPSGYSATISLLVISPSGSSYDNDNDIGARSIRGGSARAASLPARGKPVTSPRWTVSTLPLTSDTFDSCETIFPAAATVYDPATDILVYSLPNAAVLAAVALTGVDMGGGAYAPPLAAVQLWSVSATFSALALSTTARAVIAALSPAAFDSDWQTAAYDLASGTLLSLLPNQGADTLLVDDTRGMLLLSAGAQLQAYRLMGGGAAGFVAQPLWTANLPENSCSDTFQATLALAPISGVIVVGTADVTASWTSYGFVHGLAGGDGSILWTLLPATTPPTPPVPFVCAAGAAVTGLLVDAADVVTAISGPVMLQIAAASGAVVAADLGGGCSGSSGGGAALGNGSVALACNGGVLTLAAPALPTLPMNSTWAGGVNAPLWGQPGADASKSATAAANLGPPANVYWGWTINVAGWGTTDYTMTPLIDAAGSAHMVCTVVSRNGSVVLTAAATCPGIANAPSLLLALPAVNSSVQIVATCSPSASSGFGSTVYVVALALPQPTDPPGTTATVMASSPTSISDASLTCAALVMSLQSAYLPAATAAGGYDTLVLSSALTGTTLAIAVSAVQLAPQSWPSSLRLMLTPLWQSPVGFSALAISNATTSIAGSSGATLQSLSLRDGSLLSSVTVPTAIANLVLLPTTSQPIVVAVNQFASASGWALQPNGAFAARPAWTTALPEASCGSDYIVSMATAAARGIVLVGTGAASDSPNGALHALVASTGAIAWSWLPGAVVANTTFSCISGAPVNGLAVDAAGRVFVASTGTYVVDGGTGSLGGNIGILQLVAAVAIGANGTLVVNAEGQLSGTASSVPVPPPPLTAGWPQAAQNARRTGNTAQSAVTAVGPAASSLVNPTLGCSWQWVIEDGGSTDATITPLVDFAGNVHMACTILTPRGQQLLAPAVCASWYTASTSAAVVAVASQSVQWVLACTFAPDNTVSLSLISVSPFGTIAQVGLPLGEDYAAANPCVNLVQAATAVFDPATGRLFVASPSLTPAPLLVAVSTTSVGEGAVMWSAMAAYSSLALSNATGVLLASYNSDAGDSYPQTVGFDAETGDSVAVADGMGADVLLLLDADMATSTPGLVVAANGSQLWAWTLPVGGSPLVLGQPAWVLPLPEGGCSYPTFTAVAMALTTVTAATSGSLTVALTATAGSDSGGAVHAVNFGATSASLGWTWQPVATVTGPFSCVVDGAVYALAADGYGVTFVATDSTVVALGAAGQVLGGYNTYAAQSVTVPVSGMVVAYNQGTLCAVVAPPAPGPPAPLPSGPPGLTPQTIAIIVCVPLGTLALVCGGWRLWARRRRDGSGRSCCGGGSSAYASLSADPHNNLHNQLAPQPDGGDVYAPL